MEQLSQLPLFAGMDNGSCPAPAEVAFKQTPGPFAPARRPTPMASGQGRVLGILQEGQAALVKIDAAGRPDRAGADGSRGRVWRAGGLCQPALRPGVTLVCETDCVLVFLPQGESWPAPCVKACPLSPAAAGKPAGADVPQGL